MIGHDVDAINTAILLGDLVIPPAGSRVGSVLGETPYIVEGGTTNWFGTEVLNCRLDIEMGARANVFFGNFVILSVPEEAPPFEEWERL